MKAKDTVMSEEVFEQFMDMWGDGAFIRTVLDLALDKQAEISFKAGQESVYKVSVSEIYDKGHKAGEDKGYAHARQHCEDVIVPQAKAEGIRKAVNHLKMHYLIDPPEDMIKEIEDA